MIDLTEDMGVEQKKMLFLQSLKMATKEMHTLLETNGLLSAIISPEVTLAHYCRYLLIMSKIQLAYEQNILTKVAGVLPGSEQAKASLKIAADLLSAGDHLEDNMDITAYELPAEKISVAFALGFVYVISGSKLGGKIISKNIQRNLGFSENVGASYLSDQGANTMVEWKAFLSRFSGYVVDNNVEEEAIEGASFAFSSIYNYFESNSGA